MAVTAICPGSCGELLQGWLGDSQKLVSYGIDSFSRVTVGSGKERHFTDSKVNQALEKTLELFNIPKDAAENLLIKVDSDLPIAKGMASSTADIAATCQAVAAYFNKPITRDEILNICLAIERTDSILFPSLTLFEQKNGTVQKISGWCPDFHVIVLEPEQEITTEAFHSTATEQLFYQQRQQFETVYQHYLAAIEEKNVRKLGEAALQSALLNQEILPKPYFPELVQLMEQHQLLGINVAHSGSVVGLMVEKQEQIPAVLSAIQQAAFKKWYSRVKVHQSYYQGVQLA